SLGVNIEVPVTTISRCIEQVGFGFLYAPLHHPATKRVAKLRKELGFRTLFNVVGPLSNPARAVYQLVGVSSRALLEPVAEALSRLGVKRAIVAWGHDGLDEITLSGPSDIIKVDGDERRRKTISPEMFGLKPRPFAEFSGRIPADAADIIERVLNGEAGAYRDLIVLNAGAALFVSEKAESIEAGIELAHESIDSGNARSVLEQLREMCPM
ncbi:MAG: anthranilate phosphoribosyltransferase, partial [Bdellovibrionales bacterium]|nr:anthranilate phosphoribosyltransferase [Bdellovibrionales bacterium]